ncbi:MAG: hypothetical protein AUJ92_00255 [Armatimonadetes bacterium CG2_30_59_28]|nr:hypothetical protein [Armatimonadota bacterium]OIO99049.1 MAG: hypothetical protein AUJ92_00255 [Armatimonadetes bacterium CG2_30_59_28]PIU66531.1 MAG: hypothetical protein COS85_04455 [Armatimonadetes bacterium CG07_land_8_20_14_0_80_59_28]PIX39626.1 MAG: hypothetical protein COZ56_16925 [Armatimonadetes bacterium CG_4_8_14_3_um_filter_58_9]PIY48421.1 MAG: hypothetical protein COZ05_03170 [Armatimonadetes bacterium CG_4_10_14_3_um_filter_59_10]PJB72570.1 MAG: hypothetical protein CO095_067
MAIPSECRSSVADLAIRGPSEIALMLQPDQFGKPLRSILRDNSFENCNNVAGESEQGLWQACAAEGSLFINCGTVPK